MLCLWCSVTWASPVLYCFLLLLLVCFLDLFFNINLAHFLKNQCLSVSYVYNMWFCISVRNMIFLHGVVCRPCLPGQLAFPPIPFIPSGKGKRGSGPPAPIHTSERWGPELLATYPWRWSCPAAGTAPPVCAEPTKVG